MAEKQIQAIDISTASILKFVFIILFLVLLYLVRQVLIILLFAIIIASAIGPFGNWLDRKKFPRLLGILLLYLIVFALALFILSLVVPFISREVGELAQDLPRFIARVSASLETIKQESPRIYEIIVELQGLLDGLSQFLQESSQSAFGFIVKIFGGFVSFVGIIVISFYLSVMRAGIETFLRTVIPNRYENYVLNLWHRSERKLGRWFQAQILLSLIVGLMIFVGLSLLDIRFALLLAVLAMVLELVPNVGPVLAAIPAVALGFAQSASAGVWVIALYTVVQQIENQLLVPLLMGRTLGINPVVVIISLLIGFNLAGILGMILAVPLATVIVEFFNDIVEKKEKARAAVSA